MSRNPLYVNEYLYPCLRPLTTNPDLITYTTGNTHGYGVIVGNTSGNAGATLQTFDTFRMTGDGNVLDVTGVNTAGGVAPIVAAATTPVLNGVEVLNFTNAGAASVSNLTGIAPDLTTLNIQAIANTTFNVIPVSTTTLGLANIATDGLTIDYNFANGLIGAADAVNLALSNNDAATAGGARAIVSIDGNAAGQGFEVVNIEAVGANRLNQLLVRDSTGAVTLRTLNIGGTGSLVVDTALVPAFATPVINASANSGGVDIGVTGGAVTFTGGSGDDRIAFGATEFTVADHVDGGTGVNVLAIGDGAINSTTTALNTAIAAAANIQVLEFTANAVVDASQVAISNFVLDGAGVNTITNLATSDTVTLDSNNNTATLTLTPAVGVTTLDLTLSNDGVTLAGAATADFTGINTVSLSSLTDVATANNLGAVTNNANATFTVDGNAGLTITGFTQAVNYNGSALVGANVITGSGFVDSITGGARVDTLVGGAGDDVINANGGADILTGGLNADTIDGGIGNDRFNVASDSTANTSDSLATGITAGNQLTAAYLATLARTWDINTVTVGDTIRVTDAGAGILTANLANAGTSAPVVGTTPLAAGDSVFWNDGTSTYLFINTDGTAGFDATDTLLVINGVHTIGITAAAGGQNDYTILS